MYIYFVFPIRFLNLHLQKIHHLPTDCPPCPKFSNYSGSFLSLKCSKQKAGRKTESVRGPLTMGFGCGHMGPVCLGCRCADAWVHLIPSDSHSGVSHLSQTAILLVLTCTFSNYPQAWCWARVQKSFRSIWRTWNTAPWCWACMSSSDVLPPLLVGCMEFFSGTIII